jgi:predicted DNA-binding protein with PD1-like motif
MQSRRLDTPNETSFVVVLDDGEEAVESLLGFARDNGITSGRFTGLGAFSSVVLGFFDFETKDYIRTNLDEQVEVATLVGDFAMKDGAPKLHPHIVVSKRDGRAYGGHLLEGLVHPTLEVLITVAPDHLRRETDPATGLPLLAL